MSHNRRTTLPVLRMQHISKRFGAVHALKSVSIDVFPGEVHALIGENGAGKSTLMKILSGTYIADSGALFLNDTAWQPHSPADARDSGIAMIYQELTLAPHLSVEENITLGIEEHTAGFIISMQERVKKALAQLGHEDIPLNAPVSSLTIGTQQIVEIARALMTDARIIIFDEPTSSLDKNDTKALFSTISRLTDNDVAVIYISHFLEEIQQIADTYSVLRDGCTVDSGTIKNTPMSHIIRMMVGREVQQLFPSSTHTTEDVIFTAENVSGEKLPVDVSFSLCKGEILGIAGLVGAGRTELLRCLYGLDPAVAGTITIHNSRFSLSSISPSRALMLGIDYLSENRKDEGLAVTRPIRDNITLSSLKKYTTRIPGIIAGARENLIAMTLADIVHIRYSSLTQPVESLSGGNQQKVAFARLLARHADVLLLDEPTRGIDIGSKIEMYHLIASLAKQGKAIIFVSSYIPELLGMCDSLAVMHRGYLSPVLPVKDWTEDALMSWATSGSASPSITV